MDGVPPFRQNSRQRSVSDASLSDTSFKDVSTTDPGIKSPSAINHSRTNINSHNKQSLGNVQSNISDSKSVNRLQNISETGSLTLNTNGVNSSNNAKTSLSDKIVTQSSSEQTTDEVFCDCDGEEFRDPIEPRVPTFFSTMPTRYV